MFPSGHGDLPWGQGKGLPISEGGGQDWAGTLTAGGLSGGRQTQREVVRPRATALRGSPGAGWHPQGPGQGTSAGGVRGPCAREMSRCLGRAPADHRGQGSSESKARRPGASKHTGGRGSWCGGHPLRVPVTPPKRRAVGQGGAAHPPPTPVWLHFEHDKDGGRAKPLSGTAAWLECGRGVGGRQAARAAGRVRTAGTGLPPAR